MNSSKLRWVISIWSAPEKAKFLKKL